SDAVTRGLADPVDDRALVVRLARVDRDAECVRALLEARVDLGQRLAPVDVPLAHAQELEVGARNAANVRGAHACRSCLRAARRSGANHALGRDILDTTLPAREITRARRGAPVPRCASGIGPCRGSRRAGARWPENSCR